MGMVYIKNKLCKTFYYFVIIFICAKYSYATKISHDTLRASLIYMCTKQKAIINTYRISTGMSEDKYNRNGKCLNNNEEYIFLAEEMSLENKNFYIQLARIGMLDVYKLFPIKIINELIKPDYDLKLIDESIINIFKDYYFLVRKVFYLCRDGHSCQKYFDPELSDEVKDALRKFANKCIKPAARLIMSIFYVLQLLGDNTFESESCFIYNHCGEDKYNKKICTKMR